MIPPPPTLSVENALALARQRIGRQESRWLLQNITGLSSSKLILHGKRHLNTTETQQFQHSLARRAKGEPLAYILENTIFAGKYFTVNPSVLVPRPETECLVDWVVNTAKTIKTDQVLNILELGVGSGAPLAVVGMRLLPPPQSPHSLIKLYGTDCSENALKVAKKNLCDKKIDATLLQGNWFASIQAYDPHQRFHIIYSNPPYIDIHDPCLTHDGVSAEPSIALLAKDKGMDALCHIVDGAPAFLKENGWLGVEHGNLQAKACQELFKKNGYRQIKTLEDLYGKPRITFGQYTSNVIKTL